MSIASRVTSIENHLSNDYTEIARLGAELTNVDKNIENIAEAVREAYSKMPKVLGTGSNLSLSPTLKGGLDITPKGNCEQDSYSGKNQLPPTEDFNVTDTFGLKLTGTNGIYTIEHTTSQSRGLSFNLIKPYTIQTNDYIHALNTLNSNVTLTLNFNDNTTYNIGLTQANQIVSLSSNVGKTINKITLYANTNYDGTKVTLSPMILNNVSTSSEWEKYVGGIPSPNPDYPQNVRVVTGDNDVVVQNKNLLPVAFQQGFVKDDGTWNSSNHYVIATPIFRLSAGTYVCSNSNFTQFKFYLSTFDNNNQRTSNTYYATTLSFTLAQDSNVSLQFNQPLGNDVVVDDKMTLLNSKAQLELGSTASEYVPHAEQTYTLHLGTNYLAGIGDYRDEIVGKTNDWKIKRKVRHLSLAISDMNNSENYPGWLGIPNIVNDLNITESIYLFSETSALCNIVENNKTRAIRVGVTSQQQSLMFLDRTVFGSEFTQTYWKTNYPDLSLELYYGITNTSAQYQTPITDQTLISDLNNMYNLMGYDGQTNITITSSNAQMTASVSALKGE